MSKFKIPKPPRYRGRVPRGVKKCSECGWRVPASPFHCMMCGEKLDV